MHILVPDIPLIGSPRAARDAILEEDGGLSIILKRSSHP